MKQIVISCLIFFVAQEIFAQADTCQQIGKLVDASVLQITAKPRPTYQSLLNELHYSRHFSAHDNYVFNPYLRTRKYYGPAKQVSLTAIDMIAEMIYTSLFSKPERNEPMPIRTSHSQ